MIHLESKGMRRMFHPNQRPLLIYYYLTVSYDGPIPIYGIRIQSHAEDHPQLLHCETILDISDSKNDTCALIELCMQHAVTPTDLLSSIDLLIETCFQ